jgi:hypothetical protein
MSAKVIAPMMTGMIKVTMISSMRVKPASSRVSASPGHRRHGVGPTRGTP